MYVVVTPDVPELYWKYCDQLTRVYSRETFGICRHVNGRYAICIDVLFGLNLHLVVSVELLEFDDVLSAFIN